MTDVRKKDRYKGVNLPKNWQSLEVKGGKVTSPAPKKKKKKRKVHKKTFVEALVNNKILP